MEICTMIKRILILFCLILAPLYGAPNGWPWSAFKPGLTGLHIDKTLYGKILGSKVPYYVSFYCDGPISYTMTNNGKISQYMRGIILRKYLTGKYGMRWETGPTHLSEYAPKLDSLWPAGKNGDLISNFIQIGGVVAFLYFLKIENHAIVVVKKWYAPYAKIWLHAGSLNVAIANMYGMIPEIYTYQKNNFILTPIQKHPWYFIHEAQRYYGLMHGKRAPRSLAIACEDVIKFANIARDYTLGEDACLFAKNKILQRRNLHAGGGKHGPPTPADIVWALRHINRRLKNIKKAHHLM